VKDEKLQPFSEHIKELRRRLMYVITVVVVGCGVGYAIHEPLFRILKRPLGQELYYNTPVGGFNAMLKIAVLVGLVFGIPFLFYQICQFLAPAFKRLGDRQPIKILVWSIVLAATGVAFGYFVSLPSALKFLTSYDSQNITPLILVNEYLNFVFSYLLGFAVLFQLPLIMLFINRIKPQNPRKLMKHQRWVILLSFIVAAILTPTPDPVNQFIMAAPIILLYQVSVGLVWLQNHHAKKTVVSPVIIKKEAFDYPLDKVTKTSTILTPVARPKPQLTFMDIVPPQPETASYSNISYGS
jgi:sec-independent protein translocase protein TatC